MMRAGVVASSHVTTAFTDNSFARWNFNEGSGTTTADVSGNGHTMTASGTPWSASGHTAGGMSPTATSYFTGSLGTGTISTWTVMLLYRCDGAPVANFGQFIFDSSDMSGHDNNLWTDIDSTLHWGFYAAGAHYSVNPLTVGQWYHLTWAYDGTTVRCYQDGVQTSSATTTVTLKLADAFQIGKGYDGPPNGIIDDVRIFNTTLTAAEIPAYMAQPVVP